MNWPPAIERHMKPVSASELRAALGGRTPRVSRWSLDGRTSAAVLVPLHEGSRGIEVWAIKRPDGLRHHPREVAFPGGKPDPGDSDLMATAFREFEEEIGIGAERLDYLGELSPVPPATSSFLIHPFVAWVRPGAAARPTPGEVAALIVAPLREFFDGSIPFRGVDLGGYVSPIFQFEAGSMYGATAHVLEELLQIYGELAGVTLPEPQLTDVIPWQ